jgi:hypothetical protein
MVSRRQNKTKESLLRKMFFEQLFRHPQRFRVVEWYQKVGPNLFDPLKRELEPILAEFCAAFEGTHHDQGKFDEFFRDRLFDRYDLSVLQMTDTSEADYFRCSVQAEQKGLVQAAHKDLTPEDRWNPFCDLLTLADPLPQFMANFDVTNIDNFVMKYLDRRGPVADFPHRMALFNSLPRDKWQHRDYPGPRFLFGIQRPHAEEPERMSVLMDLNSFVTDLDSAARNVVHRTRVPTTRSVLDLVESPWLTEEEHIADESDYHLFAEHLGLNYNRFLALRPDVVGLDRSFKFKYAHVARELDKALTPDEIMQFDKRRNPLGKTTHHMLAAVRVNVDPLRKAELLDRAMREFATKVKSFGIEHLGQDIVTRFFWALRPVGLLSSYVFVKQMLAFPWLEEKFPELPMLRCLDHYFDNPDVLRAIRRAPTDRKVAMFQSSKSQRITCQMILHWFTELPMEEPCGEEVYRIEMHEKRANPIRLAVYNFGYNKVLKAAVGVKFDHAIIVHQDGRVNISALFQRIKEAGIPEKNVYVITESQPGGELWKKIPHANHWRQVRDELDEYTKGFFARPEGTTRP